MFVRFLLSCLGVLSLASCGGDSGSDGVVGPDWGPLTSGILEGPVTGLRYETGSESGITDENGTFSYRVGQRVRFYVGDILVGDARTAESLTLFNLAGLDSPPVTATEVRATINQMDSNREPVAIPPFETPFETAANIAALLYTLDEDGNSSNGIVIPSRIHQLATGPAFNSGALQSRLAGSASLSKLLHDAHNENVWATERAFVNRSLAMDALYASLGLVPEIYVITATQVDQDGNGEIDAVYTTTFDANGFRHDDHLDEDNDGDIDTGVELRYDASGRITSASQIAEGASFMAFLYAYDDRGHLTRFEGVPAEGSSTPGNVTYYTRDDNSLDYTASVDAGDDGSIDAIHYHHFDQEGRLLSIDQDIDNDGGIELQDLFYYDSRGQQIRVELDVNTLGVPRDVFTYNTYGQLLTAVSDLDGDGHNDTATEYHYNSKQQPVSSTQDDGADGYIERNYFWRYDANGRLAEKGFQLSPPSSYSATITYTRDELGNVLTADYRSNGSSEIAATSTYMHDANGTLTEGFTRRSDSGVITSRISYSHEKISRWGSILTHPMMSITSSIPR